MLPATRAVASQEKLAMIGRAHLTLLSLFSANWISVFLTAQSRKASGCEVLDAGLVVAKTNRDETHHCRGTVYARAGSMPHLRRGLQKDLVACAREREERSTEWQRATGYRASSSVWNGSTL
jgi:hypothetical protein